MKINEETMLRMLQNELLPGEQIAAAVYCVFRDIRLLRSSMYLGFLALTDSGRLVGIRAQAASVAVAIEDITKIKIKKNLMGGRYFDLQYGSGKENRLWFGFSPKVTGWDFPHQTEHFQTILEALEARQACCNAALLHTEKG